MKLSLEDHIKRSREAVIANKAKGNRHAEIITGLYSEPGRFIEEIIQNTEDAYTRGNSKVQKCKITFKLFKDKIEIYHSGKDFDEDDLMSVTTFANTTKQNKNEVNIIGKFGIGFKSVYSITNEPHIYSGKYAYKITDYEVLEVVTKIDFSFDGNTLIVLPFKQDQKKKIYDIVLNGLLSINFSDILFLNKLTQIDIFKENKLLKTICKSLVRENNHYRKINISTTIDKNIINENFLIFSSFYKKYNSINSIAFGLDANEHLIPINDNKVSVYFPTKQKSYLNFIVNANFTTTPTREYVPFNEVNTPENIKLLDIIIELYYKTLFELKKLKLIDKCFFNILPWQSYDFSNDSSSEKFFYEKFHNKTIEILKTEKIIPIIKNQFEKSGNIAFSDNGFLIELLKPEEIDKLFNRKAFIDVYIDEFQKNSFLIFLKDKLDVKIIDTESFGFRAGMDDDFFKNRSVAWFEKFYGYLIAVPELWNVENKDKYYSLRNKPIVFCNNKTITKPFNDNGIGLVYLEGDKKLKLKVVNSNLVNNSLYLKLFKDIGISYPDEFTYINALIDNKYKNQNDISLTERSKDICYIIENYEKLSHNQFEILKHELLNSYIFINQENSPKLLKNLTVKDKQLKRSNSNKTDADFVSEKLLKKIFNKIQNNSRINLFLEYTELQSAKNNTNSDIENDENGMSNYDVFEKEISSIINYKIQSINSDYIITSNENNNVIPNGLLLSKMFFQGSSKNNYGDKTKKVIDEILQSEFKNNYSICISQDKESFSHDYVLNDNEIYICFFIKPRFTEGFKIDYQKWEFATSKYKTNEGGKVIFYFLSIDVDKNIIVNKVINPYKMMVENKIVIKNITIGI